jgi:hypothetical protein
MPSLPLGELLSLTWAQIRFDDEGVARALELPAGRTKTNKARVIPVGPRLRAELAMRRDAPDGERLPLTAFVFGNDASSGSRPAHQQVSPACTFMTCGESSPAACWSRQPISTTPATSLGTRASARRAPTWRARQSASHGRSIGLDPEPPKPTPPADSHTIRTQLIDDLSGRFAPDDGVLFRDGRPLAPRGCQLGERVSILASTVVEAEPHVSARRSRRQ